LGLNFGHLARLLPVAERLRAHGHLVLAAVRDVASAARVFGPRGIAFVQAPHLPQGIPLGHRATGYADILLSQGWSDSSTLWGQVQSWLNLYRLFRPDRVVLDYSPTATLAARIARIPPILVGNGFELPPLTDPLPEFPGFSWADPAKAAQSERVAIANANSTLRTYGARTLTALCELFSETTLLLATVPELDHYGPRADAHYIGPLLSDLPGSVKQDWPEAEGPQIFACLRPDTSHVQVILGALAASRARVTCVARGFSERQLRPFRKPHMLFSSSPVNLTPVKDVAVCVTYGAEGTIMQFLRTGARQLISPWYVEAFMAARRITAAGWGMTLQGATTVELIMAMIERLTSQPPVRVPYDWQLGSAAAAVVDATENEPVRSSELPRAPLTHRQKAANDAM